MITAQEQSAHLQQQITGLERTNAFNACDAKACKMAGSDDDHKRIVEIMKKNERLIEAYKTQLAEAQSEAAKN